MCERKRLMQVIQSCDFALTDIVLYLDSHPYCQKGLAYFEKHKRMREEAAARYNKLFGPLNMRENCDPNRWTWVDGPWPWEMED